MDALIPRPTINSDDDGLVFAYHFDGSGTVTQTAGQWVWKSYSLTDARARRRIEQQTGLPEPVRTMLLSGTDACHLDFDEGWLHGDLPDITHEHYSDARQIGHFRFAASETMLLSGRRQPLQSVEFVRQSIEQGQKKARSPLSLVEMVMSRSLDQLRADITAAGDTLDRIEDQIVGDCWHGEREALTGVRRDTVALSRQVATVTHLFRHLEHAHGEDLPEGVVAMLARLSGRALALQHDCEQLQARARLLQDELLAKLTAQSNRLLYFISVLTAVLLPMTIVSGLFGMNVEGIPFSRGDGGFWLVSAFAVLAALAVLGLVTRAGRSRGP
ncbi:MAG: CorA family divalent cation transporter [Mesorhizobium sp.]